MAKRATWIIKDWGGNHIFPLLDWKSFDDAEQYLTEFLWSAHLDYDIYRGEYHIEEE